MVDLDAFWVGLLKVHRSLEIGVFRHNLVAVSVCEFRLFPGLEILGVPMKRMQARVVEQVSVQIHDSAGALQVWKVAAGSEVARDVVFWALTVLAGGFVIRAGVVTVSSLGAF